MNTTALLYEHDDGRYAVSPGPDAAPFSAGDPKWHRMGPVDVSPLQGKAPLTDEQAKQLLDRSDLMDMFQNIGWYSAPKKGFDQHGLSLIRAIEAAHGIANPTPLPGTP